MAICGIRPAWGETGTRRFLSTRNALLRPEPACVHAIGAPEACANIVRRRQSGLWPHLTITFPSRVPMLLSAQAARHAHRLLAARAESALIPTLSSQGPLSMEDGYDVAKNIMDIRIAQGEVMVGRKIGWTNRAAWPKMGISQPMWAPLFDSTVRYAPGNHGIQSLAGALQPRLEPEVVFRLGKTPAAGASMEELAGCIEWMAHGFEI